jgi:hypothetical protein
MGHEWTPGDNGKGLYFVWGNGYKGYNFQKKFIELNA